MAGTALLWDLIAKDSASPAFLRVAGAADKAAASTLRATKGIEGATARMSATGAALTKKLTLPLAAIGAVSVAQAAKWQKAMTLIQTAGGETATKTAALSTGLKKLATETGTSLDSLGEGIYTIAKAGAQKWTATEQLLVMKAAAEGAKAENVNLGVATDALSTVMLDYHLSASKAVGTENQLIRASGLAKTSFSDFTGSLSNVMPIASALGVSIPEVTGALATMTQHGVGAQQATENLRNLLFNLSGQNNVAAAAMQQLGINTVDLTQNLGKRGLSGTLAIVDKALKDHTKDGMVVVDVHKAAALATKSLDTEMGTFSGTLHKQSSGLLSGKVGITDYTKFAKSLGGTAGASALQFLALYKSSQGFSDQLRSGKGTITTSTSQFQKLLGGMTGASVAMQISGKYAKENAANVKEIGKAALEAGSDVLGWNKTQDTLSVKLDKAKASLQVMAVEIGTALIPAVSKLADMGVKAAHWVDGLSGTQKKVLAWSAGVLFALGPILSIGGRLATVGKGIGSFAGGVAGRLASLAGATEATALRISTAMRTATSALAGIGIGVAVGSMTKDASTKVKVLSSIGAAATGAAVGFGMGGPIGAAIGGLGAGLTSLGIQFLGAGKKAQDGGAIAAAALAQQKQLADDLFSSLQSVNGAYGAQYKQAIVSKLGKSGALGIADKAGVNLSGLTSAVMGSSTPTQMAALTMQIEKARDAGKITDKQMLSLERSIGLTGDAAASAETELQRESRAMGGGVLSSAQLGSSLKKLRAATADTGTVLDGTSAAGRRNTEVVRENVGAINTSVTTQLKHHRSVAAVASAYETQIGTLRQNLTQMGFQGPAIDAIITKYGKIPKSVATELKKRGVLPPDIQAIVDKYNLIPKSKSTTITAKDDASPTLIAIRGHLDSIHGKTVVINTQLLTTQGKPASNTGAHIGPYTGGYIMGPGTGTSDSIPAMLSNGEYVINAKQTAKHRPLLAAINRGVAGYATGGAVTRSGKDWVYSGIHYASERAADNARTRDQQKKAVKADPTVVSSAISGVGSAYSNPIDLATVGIVRLRGQIANATRALLAQISKGLSKSAAAGFRSQIHALAVEANRQLGQLRVKIKGSDLAAIKAGLKGTVQDTQAAFSTLLADVKSAGGSASLAALFTSGEARLIKNQNALASATAKLADMKTFRTGITDTLSGAFDPSQYGSVADLQAGLTGATGTNKAYTSEVSKLLGAAKGNSTLTAFINQLDAKGQTATLATLAGASKGDLANVTKSLGAYNKSVTAGGDIATVGQYGLSVSSEQGKVTALAKTQADLTAAIGALASAMGKLATRDNVTKLDSREIARSTVNDPEFEKMLNHLANLAKYGRK